MSDHRCGCKWSSLEIERVRNTDVIANGAGTYLLEVEREHNKVESQM